MARESRLHLRARLGLKHPATQEPPRSDPGDHSRSSKSGLWSGVDLWKERRSSCLTNSTCGSFMSPEGTYHEPDVESVYTHRSSVSSLPYPPSSGSLKRTRSWRSLRSSLPIIEDSHDGRFSTFLGDDLDEPAQSEHARQGTVGPAASPEPKTEMFVTASVRVWKQTPLPNWMNVFVPRYVRLCAGPQPYLEYARQELGPARQRLYLNVGTRLERLPKNKLLIDFYGTTDEQRPYELTMADKQAKGLIGEPHKHTRGPRDEWILRFETKQERDQWVKKIQDAIDLLTWINKFTLGKTLFNTPASALVECFSWLDQQQPSYVMKVLETDSKKANLVARNEIRLHHLLTNFTNHPNVLTLQDSYRQQERSYLVLEYCAGGDLFEHLRQDGAMDEASAKILFRRLIEAIQYVHEQGIVHLDIKPENLLFNTSPLDPGSIKLSDFGSAQLLSEATRFKGSVSCTVGYAAPEILECGDVSFAADVFSAGAVLYTMLGGFAPFQSPSDEEVLLKTLLGEFSLDDEEWSNISSLAKDLICGMLEVDPTQRMSLDEVLRHPWMQTA